MLKNQSPFWLPIVDVAKVSSGAVHILVSTLLSCRIQLFTKGAISIGVTTSYNEGSCDKVAHCHWDPILDKDISKGHAYSFIAPTNEGKF